MKAHKAKPKREQYAQLSNGNCKLSNKGISNMSTYKSLLQQKAELEAKIAEARKAELAHAVKQARELVAQFDLTADDVFGGKKAATGPRGTVAPKYRDPATGATWTGRGKPPKWIADKDRASFAI